VGLLGMTQTVQLSMHKAAPFCDEHAWLLGCLLKRLQQLHLEGAHVGCSWVIHLVSFIFAKCPCRAAKVVCMLCCVVMQSHVVLGGPCLKHKSLE
jgi:hypothetical protein